MKLTVTCQMDAELFAKLTNFTQAVGTCKTRIIRRAVEEFIETGLRENKGIRDRYEQISFERMASACATPSGHLKIIK